MQKLSVQANPHVSPERSPRLCYERTTLAEQLTQTLEAQFDMSDLHGRH
jgi:hypothetical protein